MFIIWKASRYAYHLKTFWIYLYTPRVRKTRTSPGAYYQHITLHYLVSIDVILTGPVPSIRAPQRRTITSLLEEEDD